MAYERTFAMLKPGVLQRRLVGEVLNRIERKGLSLIAIKMVTLSREICERHYSEHRDKYFFDDLAAYMTAGPVLVMVLAGHNAVAALRSLSGPTSPEEAAPGTIRGDYCVLRRKNVIHASDSTASAAREIELFFSPEELHPWEDGNERWLS